jgi:hypothetical protein
MRARFVIWLLAAIAGLLAVAAGPGLSAGSTALARSSLAPAPAGYEANSTQAVCALTGEHGAYVERPANYTQTRFGVNSGDSGSSFVVGDRVWWLFGNSGATEHPPWTAVNATSRWPTVTGPLSDPVALGSDSIATSPIATRPPRPAVPYDGRQPPPDQRCPRLSFVRQTGAPDLAYANPSVSDDPLFPGQGQLLSLRAGELPEAGISEGNPARQYVVFGTDNPANCANVEDITGPCAEPGPPPTPAGCDGPAAASRTRSVMTVYSGSPARFTGLYDLSAPTTRYGPACQTAPADDTARFVNVQLLNGPGRYVYVWGTEGGANNDASPVYLERIPVKRLDTGHGTQVWDANAKPARFVNGPQQLATPLFTDHPAPCMAQFGIEHNPYLNEWIMLYHCKEDPAPAHHPNGIFMRTAPHPWGPWSGPTTIFNPAPDRRTESGYCYFIYSTQTARISKPTGSPICPAGSPNASLADSQNHLGSTYGAYFVTNWVTGHRRSSTTRASSTIYWVLDTFDPYGQLIMRTTILGPPVTIVKKPPPTCQGTKCT